MLVADINLEKAEAVAEKSRSVATHPSFKAVAVKVDVADNQSVQDMVARAIAEFGRIDYNVNSAGVSLQRSSSRAWLTSDIG